MTRPRTPAVKRAEAVYAADPVRRARRRLAGVVYYWAHHEQCLATARESAARRRANHRARERAGLHPLIAEILAHEERAKGAR